MASEETTLIARAEADLDGGHAPGPAQRPVRREQYLHRVGSHATLLTVEWFPAEDGTLRKRTRFAPWPGL